MSSSPTEPARAARGWRTLHLLLAALIGFLVLLALATTLLLRQAALQPSVRQLALPLLAVFELTDANDAADRGVAARVLERQGILVRHYNKPGLRNCIRISVGRPEHTDRLLDALRRL